MSDDYMAFLSSAGAGCISGRVSEWPQLKPACKWAAMRIKELESRAAGWVSVKERLPPEGVEVLTFHHYRGRGGISVSEYCPNVEGHRVGKWRTQHDLAGHVRTNPIAWQPLPPPPTSESVL